MERSRGRTELGGAHSLSLTTGSKQRSAQEDGGNQQRADNLRRPHHSPPHDINTALHSMRYRACNARQRKATMCGDAPSLLAHLPILSHAALPLPPFACALAACALYSTSAAVAAVSPPRARHADCAAERSTALSRRAALKRCAQARRGQGSEHSLLFLRASRGQCKHGRTQYLPLPAEMEGT